MQLVGSSEHDSSLPWWERKRGLRLPSKSLRWIGLQFPFPRFWFGNGVFEAPRWKTTSWESGSEAYGGIPDAFFPLGPCSWLGGLGHPVHGAMGQRRDWFGFGWIKAALAVAANKG